MTPLGKILIVLLVVNVTMRFFTTGISIVPRVFNVADLAIVGWLFLMRLGGQYGGGSIGPRPVARRIGWFVVICSIGAFLNLDFFFAKAALGQMVMMIFPILLFLVIASSRITERDVATYQKVLYRLILLEIGIGILQFPNYLRTGISEVLLGTFQHNAEQYQAFLLIGIFYFIGLARGNPGKKWMYILWCLGVAFVIFCIDNKASWLGLFTSMLFVMDRVGMSRGGRFRIVKWVAAASVVGFVGFQIISRVSDTLYKFELLADMVTSGRVIQLGKVKAYRDILASHLKHPTMIIVGAGPSTFYSRGCRQFFLSPKARAKMYRNPDIESQGSETGERKNPNASDSMAGAVSTIKSTPYYDEFYGDLNQIIAIGTIQVDSPFAPYAGLLGETGLVGFILYLGIYWYALKLLHPMFNPAYFRETWFPLVVVAYGLCIYLLANSIWGPFIETTRYTTMLWSFIGLAYHFRRIASEKGARTTAKTAPADPAPANQADLATDGFASPA